MIDSFDVKKVLLGDKKHPLLDIARIRVGLTQVTGEKNRLVGINAI
jgi:hypothetical protein